MFEFFKVIMKEIKLKELSQKREVEKNETRKYTYKK